MVKKPYYHVEAFTASSFLLPLFYHDHNMLILHETDLQKSLFQLSKRIFNLRKVGQTLLLFPVFTALSSVLLLR